MRSKQSNPIGTSPLEWSDGAEESGWMKPFSEDVQQGYRRGYYAAAAFSDSKCKSPPPSPPPHTHTHTLLLPLLFLLRLPLLSDSQCKSATARSLRRRGGGVFDVPDC